MQETKRICKIIHGQGDGLDIFSDNEIPGRVQKGRPRMTFKKKNYVVMYL